MKRGMPSGAQTPDGIIFLLALIFSKAPPRYPPHHGAHWAYTNTKTVIPWNITAQTMIITILLHLLVSHQVAFSIGNLSEIDVRKISGTTKLLGATNCLDISPFFLYLDKNFSKLEKIIIKSLQYRRVLLNILQNSTLNKLTNYMLILEKLICTIL